MTVNFGAAILPLITVANNTAYIYGHAHVVGISCTQ